MARPRESNRHLPKYVYPHHGAWWFRPPNGENTRMGLAQPAREAPRKHRPAAAGIAAGCATVSSAERP